MIRWLALATAVGLASPGWAQGLPALHDVTGVAASDVLNLRAGPSAQAPVVGTLAPAATGIEVTALSPDGGWGRVNAGDGSGWASMRFLARQPGADWTLLASPLACHGTEPFWSARIDGGAGAIRYEDMGDASALLPILWSRPVSGVTGLLGLGLRDGGFAVLQAGDCSDGMSDRMYGLSLVLFCPDGATGSGFSGVSGCCSLAQ